jgi:serine/threonine protein kinase/Tol biopolymer transport system component
MGLVYRAHDERLGRDVALKVLPAGAVVSDDARRRFRQEALALSRLSHPHIATIHDFDTQDGVDFLVMEHLEGETLADRLARGPLAIEQAVLTAMEIAGALDWAHRQGVVHRDLKPGNIMLTRSGAKVLDFGLAKLRGTQGTPAAPGLSALPTGEGRPLTAEGAIVGTMQYMAPEQLEGKEADTRTDIFALGTVTYEMTTGRRAFTGKSQASLIASILTSDPPSITSLQPMTPPALDRLVRRCLVKDPEERWQSAHDLLAELKWITEGGQQLESPLLSGGRRWRRSMTAVAAAALVIGMTALGWVIGKRTLPGPVLRLVVPTPTGTQLFDGPNQVLAMSPDGSMMVFSAYEAGEPRLYSRRLDSFNATPVAGSEGGVNPVFSPNGEWLAFVARGSGKLRKVQVMGGTPIDVVSAAGLGLAWSEDDTLYFVQGFSTGIQALPNGGNVRAVTRTGTTKDDRAHLWPQVLPDGKTLLFTVWTSASFDDARIEAVSLKSGARTVLVRGGTHGRYVPTGHLVYARGGNLFAVRFDPSRLEISGDPVQVVEGVATGAANGEARFAFSSTGTLIYAEGEYTAAARNLVWVDRGGKILKITDMVRPFGGVSMSPDGKRLAATLQSSTYDLWIYDLDRDTLTKLTFGADDSDATWSPSGNYIAYKSTKSGTPQIYLKHMTGAGEEELLTTGSADKDSSSWTPDSKEVVVQIHSEETGWDIHTIPISGDHKPRLLVGGPYDQNFGAISPDGRWVSYRSNESGKNEVYVQSLANATMKVQVSREGGSNAQWARSGRELFFRQGEKMFATPIDAGPVLRVGKPALLFEDRTRWYDYSIAPDGRRFLVVRDVEQSNAAANHVNVVLNWFDDLKQRMANTR